MRDAPTAPAQEARFNRRPPFVLAMLLVVYTFNFIDRQILGILAGPIKADLHLSDTQLGALGGFAFALLYSTMGLPLAWLADRRGRTKVIAASLAIWSGFTALCGLVSGFWAMFACRLGVGVGEAGGVAPSYALISDTFPPQQRARALAVYSLGIPLGSAAGILLGGYVAAAVNWRAAFLAVGLAGLVFTPLFAWLVRDPKPANPAAASAMREVLSILARKRSFWLLAFGAGSCSMMGYGLAFWLPSLMRRSFGLDLVQTSQFFGLLLLIGGTVGVMAGGIFADWLGGRSRSAYAWLPAVSFLLGVPLFVAGLFSGSAQWAFWLFLMPQALVYLWLGPVLTAVQHLVPAPMRATASASFLLINNLIGVGLGSLTIGKLSDLLTPTYGDDALRHAILLGLGFYLLAAALMMAGGRYLAREWVE
ncbi:MFS transporter [Novosphingobium umbonatum]|uniref:MFS transporter n=1 Tax=Novosphingobium umbonatum TaxID=1908524 RepID=A0A437N0E3_9SPHN|nr:MFS transporter [Novosphingobium umbonatum]RVU03368.1 MFS transporter [Novosphingobium umbonatum]